jgi:hypothetical protein
MTKTFALPGLVKMVKCPHCSALLWIKEQEKVCEIDPWAKDCTDQFKEAKLVSEPTLTEFLDFLSLGVHDRETERYVRLHVWWAGNDPRRQGGQVIPMTQVEKANLRSLLPFLDESNDADRYMKAEGFRELGKFSEAEKLLATQFGNDKLRARASIIRDLNRKQRTAVEEITSWHPQKPH